MLNIMVSPLYMLAEANFGPSPNIQQLATPLHATASYSASCNSNKFKWFSFERYSNCSRCLVVL